MDESFALFVGCLLGLLVCWLVAWLVVSTTAYFMHCCELIKEGMCHSHCLKKMKKAQREEGWSSFYSSDEQQSSGGRLHSHWLLSGWWLTDWLTDWLIDWPTLLPYSLFVSVCQCLSHTRLVACKLPDLGTTAHHSSVTACSAALLTDLTSVNPFMSLHDDMPGMT